MDEAPVIADAGTKNCYIHWYIPHYTPYIQQQWILSKQKLSETPTELRFIEWSAFIKEVNNQSLWNLELSSHENMNVPVWINVGFQQIDRQDSQNLKKDNFSRLPVTSAECVIGMKKKPNSSIIVYYDDDDYSQGYVQIKEALNALTKDDILQPYISDDNFRSSINMVDDVGYKVYVFDIRYQQNFTASQSIKLEFIFNGVVPNGLKGYVLVLTNNLFSISGDGQKHFDFIEVIFNFFTTLSFFFHVNCVFFSEASIYFSGSWSIL